MQDPACQRSAGVDIGIERLRPVREAPRLNVDGNAVHKHWLQRVIGNLLYTGRDDRREGSCGGGGRTGVLPQVVFTDYHETRNRIVWAPTYGLAVVPPVRGHGYLHKTEVDRYPTTRSRRGVYGNHGDRGRLTRWCSRRRWRGGRGGRATRQDHGHSDYRHSPELAGRGHHAGRNEYRMVLATLPFPANPMETKTGLSRPGTFTLRTRME